MASLAVDNNGWRDRPANGLPGPGVGCRAPRRARSLGWKNLVLHKFAQQLDFEDLATDGVPALTSRNDQRSWAEVMK